MYIYYMHNRYIHIYIYILQHIYFLPGYLLAPGEAQRSTSKSLVRGRGAKGEKTQGDNRGLWEFHWVSMGKVSRSGDVIGISLDFNGYFMEIDICL
jgi:hypothetical protein